MLHFEFGIFKIYDSTLKIIIYELFTQSGIKKHPIQLEELYSLFVVAEVWKVFFNLIDQSLEFPKVISVIFIYLINL